MKAVLFEDEAIHYVDQSDFIRFVDSNSDYEWNWICDMVISERTFNEEGKTYYSEKPTEADGCFSQFTIKWVGDFFDVHPFMKKIIFIFND